MWISYLKIEGIRSIKDFTHLNFSKGINLLVGRNNAGKSTILNAVYSLQHPTFTFHDVTLDQDAGSFTVGVDGEPWRYIKVPHGRRLPFTENHFQMLIEFSFSRSQSTTSHIKDKNNSASNYTSIPPREPDNLFYPYLSKRKVVAYSEAINDEQTFAVTGNFSNLYAKIDRLASRYFQPGHEEYAKACEDIIGFPIAAVSSPHGKKAALIVRNNLHIPLSAMGEGVASILGLIVDLCMAESQVFLIEEIENDIHPKALKALLSLIEKKSALNQFFISTHSNIVVKYLGAAPESKIFNVSMRFDPEGLPVPKTTVKEVMDSKEERLKLLEDLGYEVYDFDLWKGWLFTEEASAEAIIKDFLIPTFTPNLCNVLRTFSSRTVHEVETKFRDFNNLFVFLHLAPIYKNKAWVIIDAGDNEKTIIDKMKDYYLKNGWRENHFIQLKKHNFEEYFPQRFQDSVKKTLSLSDRTERFAGKKKLLEDIKSWITTNPDQAKHEFQSAAEEIIQILKEIDSNLTKI